MAPQPPEAKELPMPTPATRVQLEVAADPSMSEPLTCEDLDMMLRWVRDRVILLTVPVLERYVARTMLGGNKRLPDDQVYAVLDRSAEEMQEWPADKRRLFLLEILSRVNCLLWLLDCWISLETMLWLNSLWTLFPFDDAVRKSTRRVTGGFLFCGIQPERFARDLVEQLSLRAYVGVHWHPGTWIARCIDDCMFSQLYETTPAVRLATAADRGARVLEERTRHLHQSWPKIMSYCQHRIRWIHALQQPTFVAALPRISAGRTPPPPPPPAPSPPPDTTPFRDLANQLIQSIDQNNRQLLEQVRQSQFELYRQIQKSTQEQLQQQKEQSPLLVPLQQILSTLQRLDWQQSQFQQALLHHLQKPPPPPPLPIPPATAPSQQRPTKAPDPPPPPPVTAPAPATKPDIDTKHTPAPTPKPAAVYPTPPRQENVYQPYVFQKPDSSSSSSSSFGDAFNVLGKPATRAKPKTMSSPSDPSDLLEHLLREHPPS